MVGLVNATGLQLGDTLYDGRPAVDVPADPARSRPRCSPRARPLDTGRVKQFRKGLEQLDEEGVVQVLRDPDMGDASLVLAAVGQLQFEVFAHRLDSEFNAPIEILSAPYQAIRLTDKESPTRLRDIGGIRILARGDGALVALFENHYRAAAPRAATSPSSRSTTSSPADPTGPSAPADHHEPRAPAAATTTDATHSPATASARTGRRGV